MVCRVAENSLPGRLRQDERALRYLSHKPLVIGENEEECFVLDDRTAEASAELIPVSVVLCRPVQVLKIRLRVQDRIVIRVERRAVELVRARARSHLYLSGAAAERGINVVRTHAEFFDHIRAHED